MAIYRPSSSAYLLDGAQFVTPKNRRVAAAGPAWSANGRMALSPMTKSAERVTSFCHQTTTSRGLKPNQARLFFIPRADSPQASRLYLISRLTRLTYFLKIFACFQIISNWLFIISANSALSTKKPKFSWLEEVNRTVFP